MTRTINLFSLKGGQGVSTTAVLIAKAFAAEGKSVLLIESEDGDIHDLINTTKPTVGVIKEVSESVSLLALGTHEIPTYGFDVVITDLGEHQEGAENYLVTQPCYLSLKRAVGRDEILKRCDGVITVRPADRVLSDRDVTTVLGLRLITSVDIDASVARASDAGLLLSRGKQVELLSLV